MNIQNAEWKLELEWDEACPVYVTKVGGYLLELKVATKDRYYLTSTIISQLIIANSLEEAIEKVKIIWTEEVQKLITNLQSTL
jgi:hypothetical protein